VADPVAHSPEDTDAAANLLTGSDIDGHRQYSQDGAVDEVLDGLIDRDPAETARMTTVEIDWQG
jgi:hypothetical protein